jgi:hypothetical protein
VQRRGDERHDTDAERHARPEPAAVRLAVGRHRAGDAADRRQRHRLLLDRAGLPLDIAVRPPCQDKYVVDGQDEISRRIAETAPKVDAVLDGIRARSPLAKILVVNYSAILPHTGNGCWPQLPVARDDVPYMRAKQEELNAMLADEAAANGATLVAVYAASRGHDACALPGVRWVEPVVPVNAAAPLHPSLLGMQAMSTMVVAAARG